MRLQPHQDDSVSGDMVHFKFCDFASLLYLYQLKQCSNNMNLLTLIKQYFSSKNEDLTIDVFDEKNIYDVYQRVVGVLTL